MTNRSEVNFDSFQIKFLAPVYSIESCVALIGSSVGLWLMLTRGLSELHAGLVFSINLAVSDLLYASTLPLLAYYYFSKKDWIFGEALCKTERFLFTCNLYGSMIFIACISVTRYLAIAHPFFTHSYSKPKHACIVSVVIWVVNFVICFPAADFAAVTKDRVWNNTECVTAFDRQSQLNYLPYSLFLAVFGCALPFLATFSSYVGILITLRENSTLTQLERKKIVQVAFVVVALYAVSFIPYHVLRNLNLYLKLDPDTAYNRSVYSAYQVTKALVAFNPCVHPLLYAALLNSIRRLCGWPTTSE